MYLNNTKTVQMSVIGGVIPWAPKIPWVLGNTHQQRLRSNFYINCKYASWVV